MVISKQQMLENMVDGIKSSKSFVFTEYQGLKVNELEELRKDLKKMNARYHVVKNTILCLAFKNLGMEDVCKELSGTTGIMFVKNEDPTSSVKKLIDFSKEHEKLKIRTGCIFGRVFTTAELKHIASLPSREVLLGQVVGVLKTGIGSFIGILRAPIERLVYSVDQIQKSKSKES